MKIIKQCFLFVLIFSLAVVSCRKGKADQAAEAEAAQPVDTTVYDLVITGGRVLDPETGFDKVADIGISGDKIARISTAETPLKGQQSVDASGFIVSPGFIDTMVPVVERTAQKSWNVYYWKVADGVTTVLWLHDGTGYIDEMETALEGWSFPVNYGYGTRIADYYIRKVPDSEREGLIRKNLENGALSVSISPEYQSFVSTEESIAYGKLAAEYGVPLASHLRYSHKNNEIEGGQGSGRRSGAIGSAVLHFPSEQHRRDLSDG